MIVSLIAQRVSGKRRVCLLWCSETTLQEMLLLLVVFVFGFGFFVEENVTLQVQAQKLWGSIFGF